MARQGNIGEKGMDGVEKSAILLIALGPEKSAEIFKHLKEEEIEQLTLEIANTSSVSHNCFWIFYALLSLNILIFVPELYNHFSCKAYAIIF